MIWRTRTTRRLSPTAAAPIRDSLLPTSSAGEGRLGRLDMAGHSNPRVSLHSFIEQRLRFFAITWGGAIKQHHRVKAAYVGLFEAVGKGLSVLKRDPKVSFSSFPLTCRRRGDTGDRMSETVDRP